ncbi:hypothetical protein SDDV_ORF140 [Scale drop disease virus]
MVDEQGYLDQVAYILKNGSLKQDRTNTSVRSIFGCQNRYNLRNQFPLLTTKKCFGKALQKNCYGLSKVVLMLRNYQKEECTFGMRTVLKHICLA